MIDYIFTTNWKWFFFAAGIIACLEIVYYILKFISALFDFTKIKIKLDELSLQIGYFRDVIPEINQRLNELEHALKHVKSITSADSESKTSMEVRT
ncbi:MAG: hypothetical protein L7F77_11335 [Candidatus Magnetominusculus sp. LBB02]|nr:hypothetical protein [Candidatus Magnetominusculus sp. LBB02]